MTPIYLPKDALRKRTAFEVAGKSPAISPQNILNQANVLLAVAGNPILSADAGLDTYALVQAIIANGALKNLAGVQISRDEVERRKQAAAQQAALQAMGVPPGGPA